MYKLCLYVPASHLEQVKAALFEAGAGKVGNYDSCCWQTLGTGQFRALKGSQPFIGQQNGVEPGDIEKQDDIEKIEEYKLEMVCADGVVQTVVDTLRQIHPYEEPAFDLVKLENEY